MKNYENFFEKDNSILDAVTSNGFIYGVRRLDGELLKVNPQFEKLFNPEGKKVKGKAIFSKGILDIINHPYNDVVEANVPVVEIYSFPKKVALRYLVVKLPIIQDDEALELIMLIDVTKHHQQLAQSYLSDVHQKKEINLYDIIGNLKDLMRLHEEEFILKNSSLNSSIIPLIGLIFKDSLTGLSNRRSFEEAISREVQRYRRSQHGVALVLLDLDEFKAINDKFGHAVGDAIILQLSELLVRHTREADMVFRWGGDEFAIIMEIESDAVKLVLNKLRTFVAKHSFKNIKGKKVTISLGASMLQKGDTVDSWFKKSDKALYKSKENGRNKVSII